MLKAVKASNEKGALAYLFNEVKALRAQLEGKTDEIETRVSGIEAHLSQYDTEADERF